MYPTLFEISGHILNSWMLMILIGGWIAFFYGASELRLRGVPDWQIYLASFGMIPTGLFSAHVGQVLTVGTPFFGSHEHFQLSGFVLYGAVFGFVIYGIVLWYLFRWYRLMYIQEIWDFGAIIMAWIFGFARLGCTLYGCCYGSPSGPWPGYSLNEKHWDYSVRPFPSELRGIQLHPTPLYEAVGFFLILGVLYWARRVEAKKPGTFPAGVMGWFCWLPYAVIRFVLEYIRLDPRGSEIVGLSPSQWIAIVTFCLGVVLIQKDKKMARIPLFRQSSG
jgi:phosphatidylglycerol:prolipoprotein diacylglycerol transferase